MNFQDFLNEGSKITIKRRYTENHPAITAGKSARIRNKMLEAIADGKITQDEFDAILREYSKDSSRWIRRNSKYFNVSEEGISLSRFGKRALLQITINESIEPICEATVEMDAIDPDNKDFLKFLKKHRVKIINKEMDGPGGGTPVITMQGKRKDLEAVLSDGEYGWDDPDLAEYIEEGRAFVAAAKKAKDEGKEEFEFDGETFPVTIKENSEELEEKAPNLAKKLAPGLTGAMADTIGVPRGTGLDASVIDDEDGDGIEDEEEDDQLHEGRYSIKLKAAMDALNKSKYVDGVKIRHGNKLTGIKSIDVNTRLIGDLVVTKDGEVFWPYKDRTWGWDSPSIKHLIKTIEELSAEEELNPSPTNDYNLTEKVDRFEKEAKDILSDLMDEFDPWELTEMMPEEAEETVARYGHKGPKAKKIADHLYNLASTGTFESKNNNKEMENNFVYESFGKFVESLTEAKSFSKSELESTAQAVADARAKFKGIKTKVIEFEMNPAKGRVAGFYIHDKGDKYGPGRYWITDSGEVVSAFRHDTFGDGVLGKVGSKVADFVKSFKANESVTNESKELITEKFKSMKLQSILTGAGSMPKDFAKAFYTMSRLALSDIQDVDIIEMDPDTARKEKRNNAVYLYFTSNEKENPYAGRDSWRANTIPANTLLAATDGQNEWLVSEYQRRFSASAEKTLRAGKRDDSVGFGKSGARDSWGSGISSLTKATELADRAYVLDLDVLRARYGTDALRGKRQEARSGATAFKSDKDFKKANLDRYHVILANRAAQMPIDDEVLKAIDIVTDQIKDGLSTAKKGRYGDVIIGTDPKGRELKLRDASNAMSNLLDDFNRYVDYTEQAKRDVESGYSSGYYEREVKNYAKSIKDRINKIKNMDYAW